ncbi:DUF4911 domain-containing protein [Desulfonatronovibrio magnus]|uniref:DUF4911 domain-containing protein n=1 Tax=Desulfonatronovibrio magnus TaxID=698827 RepID=UPI0005EBE6D2|nr:DUF4911 domain-containing protein [Desulfonatronovibrio magnus]
MSTSSCFSQRLYIRLNRKDIAFFKFLLESRDNLAYLTVIDKYLAVVQIVFGYGFEHAIQNFLDEAGQDLVFKIIYMPV